MKKLIFMLLLSGCIRASVAQTIPSDCTVPDLLTQYYNWDIKNLALRRMAQVNSTDLSLINIPASWQDTIMEGLAAILNAPGLPEADTVFNLYCVHDDASAPWTITKELIVGVDSTYAWVQNWKNHVTETGVPVIDSLTAAYDLRVVDFYTWSFGWAAILGTDSLWNVYALGDSLETVDGIVYSDPNSWIGRAGQLYYNMSADVRFYDFKFEWNDCFDGCDNSRTWKFAVYSDCSVQYLGATDTGFFGIEPLPSPPNCQTFTGITYSSDIFTPEIFPNPADEVIYIKSNGDQETELILYDLNGSQLMKSYFSGSGELNIAPLPGGLYLLEVKKVDGSIQRFKIVRQ